MSLVARHLEGRGIPTAVLGSARDIVEGCGAPRFLFSDFPLGNPCGRPFDPGMQRHIVSLGLDLLETAREARTTVQTPYVWSDDESWRERYMQVDPAEAGHARLREQGATRRRAQRRVKQEGRARSD